MQKPKTKDRIGWGLSIPTTPLSFLLGYAWVFAVLWACDLVGLWAVLCLGLGFEKG